MAREEYLKVGDRLPEPPEGRDYHVCAGDDGALYFVEVWESAEAMDAHNERLGPVLQDLYGAERFVDTEPEGYARSPRHRDPPSGERFVRPGRPRARKMKS